jgi:hypothetical protein
MRKKPGYLAEYARARGITHAGMRKQLLRVGINYLEPFSWEIADRLLDGARHLARDSYRLRRVVHP